MIIGLTRIRNEEDIIKDTLDHWGKICDGGIIVYDDVSTDKTVSICESHPAVRKVIKGEKWNSNRAVAEYEHRDRLLEESDTLGVKESDWLVYFDADERIYLTDIGRFIFNSSNVDAIKCRLLDVYITEEDKDSYYLDRDYVGPEYRDILFFFRRRVALGYSHPDQRECSLIKSANVIQTGFIKHFGKGISIKQWEDTCDYYSNHFPMYAEKWRKRKGKAIHTESDFGRPLVKFSDVTKGKACMVKL